MGVSGKVEDQGKMWRGRSLGRSLERGLRKIWTVYRDLGAHEGWHEAMLPSFGMGEEHMDWWLEIGGAWREGSKITWAFWCLKLGSHTVGHPELEAAFENVAAL